MADLGVKPEPLMLATQDRRRAVWIERMGSFAPVVMIAAVGRPSLSGAGLSLGGLLNLALALHLAGRG